MEVRLAAFRYRGIGLRKEIVIVLDRHVEPTGIFKFRVNLERSGGRQQKGNP